MLPYNINKVVVWLKRMKYVKGFGIQSPSAFAFANDVINDHRKYGEYDLLQKGGKQVEAVTEKKARLMFRLSRFHKADAVWFYSQAIGCYEEYIQKGWETTLIKELKAPFSDLKDGAEARNIFYISVENDYEKTYEALRNVVNTNSFLGVDNIYRNAETRAFWQQIVADERVSFSFDLYYLGIAFFDKRPKQNYIINF